MATEALLPLVNPGVDFDAVRQRMQSAPAFPHFCIDDFLDPHFAREVHDAFPSYETSESVGRAFHAVNEYRKTQVTDPLQFPEPVQRLYRLLCSDEFVARMSYLSGISGLIADPALSGGGMHQTREGGRLDVHVDFNVNVDTGLHRRLNLLLYFNLDWRDEYGGELDLWDAEVQHCVRRIAPRFNRAAGFATGSTSWHGVTPVHCPPGIARKSFACYYYTREAPQGWDGVKHSTIFRPRPDEFWRGAVAMPAEEMLRSARRKIGAVKQTVRRLIE
jgi:Rps23 Pro-64 3,4-dihydroxylase Tpa1-like proline 4-hydroxylase